MEAYCVIHEQGFKILDYNTFKESGNEQVVHFIGTYKECLDFISRSTAAQELVDSTNREHKIEQPYYQGDGNHSVKELESICRQYKEYVHQLMTRETYTREEVYLVAERSIHKAINNILTQEHTKISEVINSEIDTVKLF